MAELADALDSGSSGGCTVGVQVPSAAPARYKWYTACNELFSCKAHHRLILLSSLPTTVCRTGREVGFFIFRGNALPGPRRTPPEQSRKICFVRYVVCSLQKDALYPRIFGSVCEIGYAFSSLRCPPVQQVRGAVSFFLAWRMLRLPPLFQRILGSKKPVAFWVAHSLAHHWWMESPAYLERIAHRMYGGDETCRNIPGRFMRFGLCLQKR